MDYKTYTGEKPYDCKISMYQRETCNCAENTHRREATISTLQSFNQTKGYLQSCDRFAIVTLEFYEERCQLRARLELYSLLYC